MGLSYDTNILPHLFEGVYIVDKNRQIVFWNEGSEQITGYSAEEVTNSICYQNILQHVDESGKHLCHDGCPLQKTLNDGIINEARVFLKHKEGHRIPVMIKTMPIHDAAQNIVAAIEIFTDERFRKQMYKENAELKDKLRTNPLTQAANRIFLDFHLNKRIEEAKKFSMPFGVLMIDIDHFKAVNDTYGHIVGDEILKKVANSLLSNVAKTDIVSRWGGEEFVLVIDVDNKEDLEKIAERLRSVVMTSSFKIDDGTTIGVTVSIGGTMVNRDDDSASLIARADGHMYDAKRSGRNRCQIK